ncbi:hypothetical protein B425_3483 [Bacillus amyloliquefaciens]|nr:hypothetical protein B425_3483 [Bacillus amyloliquefaciens]
MRKVYLLLFRIQDIYHSFEIILINLYIQEMFIHICEVLGKTSSIINKFLYFIKCIKKE